MKQLTVFIVTYNREKYLPISIDSVLSQTYTDFDLVILDNASTDNTKAIIEPYLSDSRVSYIRHKSNLGSTGNINYALLNCKTKYMIIFHDDDCMLPNLIEEEIRCLENNESIVAVSGNALLMDDNGIVSENKMIKRKERRIIYSGCNYLLSFLSQGGTVICPMVMYRTDFFNNIGLVHDARAGYAADQALWFEVEKNGGMICVLNEVLLHYRRYLNQESTQNRMKMEYQLFNYLVCNSYYLHILEKSNIELFKYFYRMIRLGGKTAKIELNRIMCGKLNKVFLLHLASIVSIVRG